jgi:hypothetical protein
MSMPRAEQLALVALLDGTEQGTTDVHALVRAAHEGGAPDDGTELEVPPQRRAAG